MRPAVYLLRPVCFVYILHCSVHFDLEVWPQKRWMIEDSIHAFCAFFSLTRSSIVFCETIRKQFFPRSITPGYEKFFSYRWFLRVTTKLSHNPGLKRARTHEGDACLFWFSLGEIQSLRMPIAVVGWLLAFIAFSTVCMCNLQKSFSL